MQNFRCNYIKNKYSDKPETLITDTDNFVYKILAEIVQENFYKVKKLFHFSNYTQDSKYYNKENNLVIAKMKDKT